MFVTKRIGPKSKDLGKIKKLYEEAFPENENHFRRAVSTDLCRT